MASSVQTRRRTVVRSVQWAVAASALVLAVCPSGRLAAQGVGRIAYTTYTLPNGLRVVFSQDHSTPIVTVNVWYHVGSANERPRRSGFAHLFEHMMSQGSAHVRKAQHYSLVERAGGALNASTTEDRTNYYETLPSNRLNLGLWLEADRMRSLAITQENFENQRQAVKEERRLRVDNTPYTRFILDALTWLADSTSCFAYAHTLIGDMADLDSARVEDVQAFFDQFYRPNNAVLTVAGDFDETEARGLIERYFGTIPAGPAASDAACTRPDRGARRLEVTDNNANLPLVAFFYPAPPEREDDAAALDLLTTILGGGESSRLNLRVVRQERVAVQASSFLFGRRLGSVVGVIGVTNQGQSPARLEQLLAEEVDRLRNDSVAQAELAKAQNQYRTGAIRSRQTTFGVAETLQSALRVYGDLEAANTEPARYLAVTVADIRRVAQRYLAPEQRLTLIINPPGTNR